MTLIGGYTCTCGAWVPHGQYHQCMSWNQQPWASPTFWTWPAGPSVTRYRGSVEELDDLPDDAIVGDGVYVRDLDALVTRVASGWHHFDRA